jgi:predicted RNA-binding protein YlxR (DUF448 family)
MSNTDPDVVRKFACWTQHGRSYYLSLKKKKNKKRKKKKKEEEEEEKKEEEEEKKEEEEEKKKKKLPETSCFTCRLFFILG